MILDTVKQDRRHGAPSFARNAMALFFDADWFDARLGERGLSRAVLAAAAGLGPAELALVFKDQRELSAQEVAIFAELLGVAPAEVAARAGVSTPVPSQDSAGARIAALEKRVAALEAEVVRLRRG
jgi:lambda repressor-like predicted transcriptional regulator